MAGARDYVYLDHAATSPLRPEARSAMEPFADLLFANPSGSHKFAREARRALDEARDTVAGIIGCSAGEIVFTSGGTEGANSAVLGAVRRLGGRAACSSAEHHAVLHCVEHVGGVVVPVGATGVVDPDVLASAVSAVPDVSVVSVMAVNNETGAVTDIAAVSRALRKSAPGAVLHTDAVQAPCWLDLRGLWPHVDVLTISGHKFGGPKGAGVMAVRQGVALEPLLLGGGQERDRRSGTHNVAGIVGTARALEITDRHRDEEVARIGSLRNMLIDGLVSSLDCALATVPAREAAAGIAHVCMRGLENESLLYLLDEQGVCASAASACASGAMEPSHVLAAMGVPRDLANGSLRFSLGYTTTESDITAALEATVAAARRLQSVRVK